MSITPICVFDIHKPADPGTDKPLWDMVCSHYHGTQSVSVESREGLWTLLTLPARGQSSEKIISRPTPLSDVSPRYVLTLPHPSR